MFPLTYQSQCLTVALGPGHSKIALHIFFYIFTFIMADQHHFSVQEGKAANQGTIITKTAITVELHKAGKYVLNVVHQYGATGMTCNLNRLPESDFHKSLSFAQSAFVLIHKAEQKNPPYSPCLCS